MATGVPELEILDWDPDGVRNTRFAKEFHVAPGDYSGDAFNLEEATQALLAMRVAPEHRYLDALVYLMQGDHLADFKEFRSFVPELPTGTGAVPTVEPGVAPVAPTQHFAIVLDASGSMAARSGARTRMEEAKAAVTDFLRTLPEGTTASLRVYGHEGDNSEAGREVSCASSETIFHGDPADESLLTALEAVVPTGWTPLSRSITDSVGDIPEEATVGVVYVVTDGIETCGGDPVSAASQVADSGVQPIINVIGFEVDDEEQVSLRQVAEAGRGDYIEAGDSGALHRYLSEERSRIREARKQWLEAEEERLLEEAAEMMRPQHDLVATMADRLNEDHDNMLLVVDDLEAGGHLRTPGALRIWVDQRRGSMELELTQMLRDQEEEMVVVLREQRVASRESWDEIYGDR